MYWEFYHQKMKTFRWKILIFFSSFFFQISAQNIDCGYSLDRLGEAVLPSTHNLCFLAEIRKIMYIPVNPSLTVQKWGLKGSKLYRCVFRDVVERPIGERWCAGWFLFSLETHFRRYICLHCGIFIWELWSEFRGWFTPLGQRLHCWADSLPLDRIWTVYYCSGGSRD